MVVLYRINEPRRRLVRAPDARAAQDRESAGLNRVATARPSVWRPALPAFERRQMPLTGRAYSAPPTAFKYRRTLVASCLCRPPQTTNEQSLRIITMSCTTSDRRHIRCGLILPDGAWA
jgi:Protein of unknown function (DUF2865)